MAKTMIVMTFNTEHCSDRRIIGANEPAPVDTSAVAYLIKKHSPDVVGLNEIKDASNDCKEMEKQTEKIAVKCGFKYYEFARGVMFPWGDDLGNSILSSYKITDVKTYPVKAPVGDERRKNENDWYEDRVILVCTIDIGKPIKVISTHFGLNGLEQERMVDELCRVIDGCNEPIILMGDFNATPHTDILKPIYARLHSAADIVGNSDFTWASFAPDRILDYIFVSDGIKVINYEVVKEIVSDHFAVKAVINV